MRSFAGLLGAIGALAFGAAILAPGAHAQKSGGILKMYFQDNPPSASIHEEATTSTVVPFMGIYNNLVVFDQRVPQNSLEIDPARSRRRAGPGAPTARISPLSCAMA